MTLSIVGLTKALLRRWRFRLRVFFVRMWFFSEWARLTRPEPVREKRLLAPL